MDYTEAFKNLRTNNKWGRKSSHKAVLMLTVIELFEKNILTDNEIFYDDKLKSMFLKVLMCISAILLWKSMKRHGIL